MSTADPALQRVLLAARQAQFLHVVDRETAHRRLRARFAFTPIGLEELPLAQALGRVLGRDVVAAVDVPLFDRASVDGFALRAGDTQGATAAAPIELRLGREILTPGVRPQHEVAAGEAAVIATGGMLPRGADAVVMVEHTDVRATGDGPVVQVRRPATPGQFVAAAGSDLGRGETLLHAGIGLGSRELGVMAAAGVAIVPVHRRPRVAILSTGDELVPPGAAIRPGQVYDTNATVLAAAVAEQGGEPVALGIAPDDEGAIAAMLGQGLACELILVSGGTSKGAGDLATRALAGLQGAEILAHGVALKPGKPLCIAAIGRHPVFVLPGFPTSAIVTFHEFVAPLLRAMGGRPEPRAELVEARVPVRVASERGRTEYVLVSLVEGPEGLAAYPAGKGSGAITSFAQADGFITVEAQAEFVAEGTMASVRLLRAGAKPVDLAAIGSHCVGLDLLLSRLAGEGWVVRSLNVGSMGGLAAARRGECDVAGIHLLDPRAGRYNQPFLSPGLLLLAGYRRLQGVLFRPDDRRFAAGDAAAAIAAAAADPARLMVNRNAGSGTRLLVDGLLGGARPGGYWNQARSHNAVAAAVQQGRADWGVAILPVARAYGLSFLPLRHEHYDFVVPESRWHRPAVRRFAELLTDRAVRDALAGLGFEPYELPREAEAGAGSPSLNPPNGPASG